MRTKLRASKITIEMPKEDSEIWVRVTVQQMIYDGDKLINVIPQYDYITKPLREFVGKDFNYIDSAGNAHAITGVNVMMVITGVVMKWMVGKYDGQLDEKGDLWLS